MKENLKLRLVYMTIGVVVAGIVACFLYQNKKEFWREQACDTFTEALKEEVQNRGGMEVYFAMQGNMKLSTENKDTIIVPFESEYGLKSYAIPSYKFHFNIESNSNQQGLHTIIFEEHPLSVDSLNMSWSSLLKKIGFCGKNITRLSTTDWLEKETKAYSKDSDYVSKSDSLVSYYIGARCEIEATGFIYFSWWNVFSAKEILSLCGIVLACLLLLILFEKGNILYRRYFVKRIQEPIKEEVPEIAKDEGPVAMLKSSKVHIYQIGDVLFDADTKMLKRGDVSESLFPQVAKLLQFFLDAEDYKLSSAEIQKLLWGEEGNGERMHTAIKRLRESLSKVTDWSVEKLADAYQLRIPHFIEEMPQLVSQDR